jgi:hypothetical protein
MDCRALAEALGFEACAALCRSNNEVAPLHLRVNTMRNLA